MEYVRLGESGLVVSKLCLGTMNMGSPKWKPWIFDEAQSEPIVRHALDSGVNFIDLADFYSFGEGERVIGNIIKKHAKRDELVLLTKAGYPIGDGKNNQGHSRKHLYDALHGSLERIGTDYVDIFMLHYFDVNTPIEETWFTLNEMVKQGKTRYLGVSTMYTWQFAKILHCCEKNGWVKPINMQLQLNAAYREEEREMIPFCVDQGIGVSVFSPLARGLLSGAFDSVRNQTDNFTHQMFGDDTSKNIAMSVAKVAKRHGVGSAQVAQAWVLSRPGVKVMLVGADTTEQFNSSLNALTLQLTEDDFYELDRVYTPCDVINDYTEGKRIAREPRPARD
ncbi:aldo/keto reductase [Thorsellia kenyensis]|uniref:Aldo/keto reductase n=1 Tax=Thorsellia kenyensis TaxID=1549888 RepID=A0ABV6C7E9_9GAMM